MFIQIILDCDTHRSCKQTQAALDSLSLGVPGRRRHRRRRFRFFCRRAFLPTHANLSTSKQCTRARHEAPAKRTLAWARALSRACAASSLRVGPAASSSTAGASDDADAVARAGVGAGAGAGIEADAGDGMDGVNPASRLSTEAVRNGTRGKSGGPRGEAANAAATDKLPTD
jgi:hypothetical protein